MTKETLSELYQVDFKIMTIGLCPSTIEASEFSVLLSKRRTTT